MRISLMLVLLAAAWDAPGGALAQSMLRVGAAKVDVTPAENELPQNFEGILDRIYSRAVVIDDGASTAALISVDAGAIPDAIWQAVTGRLESELGIPTDNVMLTATHTHSAPRAGVGLYTDKIVESVRLAQARLTSARVGYGTGVSYLNVNRNLIDRETRRTQSAADVRRQDDTVAFARETGEIGSRLFRKLLGQREVEAAIERFCFHIQRARADDVRVA